MSNQIIDKIKQFWGQTLVRYQSLTAPLRTRYQQLREKRPWLAISLKVGTILGVSGFLFIFFFCLFIHQGVFGKLPTYADLISIQNNNASEVYSEDSILLGKYFLENRINADFEEISPNIINALVATEDARFFVHGGIDFRAWLRVLFKSILLFDDSSGGGSTISQQLAKNLFPRHDYLMLSVAVNKVKEMFIARRLERIYTKEELLRVYLNTVPFSENIFGIKVAAQRFFDKSSSDLNVEEAAVLVGMLKATTYYNPLRHKERALQRRNVVLGQMEKYGYLEAEMADSLRQLPLEIKYYKESRYDGLATYFRAHLRPKLEAILKDFKKPDGSDYDLDTDGLKIYTSINAQMQQYAEAAVQEQMPLIQKSFHENWNRGFPWSRGNVLENAVKDSKRYKSLVAKGYPQEKIDSIFSTKVTMRVFSWKEKEEVKEMSPLDSIKHYLTLLNVGFLAIEPQSGLVKAWVGGIDHKYIQYDHVLSQRQVGSTFKPIVYAKALDGGMLPCEYTRNRQVAYVHYDNWSPRNSDGKYGGAYSMEGALSHSVNATTVEIIMRAKVDSVINLAHRMGISSDIPSVPAISLGAVDASLHDMVKVYSTFANRGKRPEMHYLDRIETRNGEVLVEFSRPEAKDFHRVLSSDHADVMVRMMESVIDSGTARSLRYKYKLYGDIAGKTGTTQKHSDGWFIGFTPNLVAGVWVGAESPQVHFRSMSRGQGAKTALPIWGSFMKSVYNDPAFTSIRKAKFVAPNDTLLALMQCPPYLEEMPILADYRDGDDPKEGFFQRIFNPNPNRRNDRNNLNVPPRRHNESDEAYMERIRQHQQRQAIREQKQAKRKEYWNKVLFGKKEN